MADTVVAPFLVDLSQYGWFKFCDEFAAYKARGGVRSMKELISSSVISLLTLRGIVVSSLLDDSSVINAISVLFAPATPLEAYDRFRSVSVVTVSGGRVSFDALLQYISVYERLCTLSHRVMPPDVKLRESFIAGLKPERLQERVEFRMPANLLCAQQYALEEFEKLLAIVTEAALVGKSLVVPGVDAVVLQYGAGVSMVSSNGAAAGFPVVSAPDAKREPIVCHGCGVPGHIKPNCPERRVVKLWYAS
jgi:hypothetical protein